MVRFENIRVEYDITDTDFYMPALSIQPIVENAIRHGVRIREEGIVRVSTRLNDGYDVSASSALYDVTKDYTYSGTEVTLKDGQTAVQFECNRCHEHFTIINSIDEE